METNKIDAGLLSNMFLAGAKRLEAKKEIINELNVFPVPDGDTGTNMNLTIVSAVNEVKNITDMNMQVLSKSISSGSLRGARGNSGVILSQLLRGFTKVIRDVEEIDIDTFTQACQKGVETAYKAVMKPKEGTILTVARGAAEKAVEISDEVDNFEDYFKQIIDYAQEVLDKTPDMLPVLKEAGVVDSGGQGLLEMFKGAYAFYVGEDVDSIFADIESNVESDSVGEDDDEISVIGYDTSFVIRKSNENKSIDAYVSYLESMVSELKITEYDDAVAIKAFAEDPGRILSKALSYGSLDEVSIEPCTEMIGAYAESVADDKEVELEKEIATDESKNVNAQNVQPVNETAANKNAEPSKEMGFIAVSVGEGLSEIFKSLGVDYVIKGGQTMNPSTEDILKAVEEVDAKNVFVLPNNKNIILAANQAQYLVEDKNIIVIPTKSIPQGITALVGFMNDNSPEENEAAMLEAIESVKTGQVTFAVRDTVINGKEIHQGNIMGIGDSGILSVGTVVEETALEMIEEMVDEDSELISIYFGDEVDEEIANDFAASVEEKYPDCDVQICSGGQPIYYYIVSVE